MAMYSLARLEQVSQVALDGEKERRWIMQVSPKIQGTQVESAKLGGGIFWDSSCASSEHS